MSDTVQYQIRVDQEKLEKFSRINPWRGAFPQFVDQCLTEFLEKWGDKPSPSDITSEVVKNIHDRRF